MAATDRLTLEHRRQTLALRAATIRDLQRLWPALDLANLDGTFPVWLSGVGTLVTRDRGRAAGLAAAYLTAHRDAAGVPGSPEIRLAPQIAADRLETSLRVTSIVAIRRGLGAGFSPEKALTNAFVQSSGAATRFVLEAGRETIRRTSLVDSRARGWQRVTVGGCNFCQMLAGRGAVYSDATVDFRAHDHCGCTAEPVYR